MYIVNPASGRGGAGRRWDQVPFDKGLADVRFTTRPGEAVELARQAVQDEAKIVVACGGDGTVSEVASALVHTSAALALIPLGTGNDFSRTIGLGTDLVKAVGAIRTGKTQLVDTIEWISRERTGMCVNISGCGFDAVVADRINRGYRLMRGTSAYVAAVLQTLTTYQPAKIRVFWDGEEFETTAMLCAIANAQSYGGGMRVAPQADVADGLIDVVIVQGIGRAEFLKAFPKVFQGTHISHPRVLHWRCREITVESEVPLPTLCDGELIGTTPVTFRVQPASLKLVVP